MSSANKLCSHNPQVSITSYIGKQRHWLTKQNHADRKITYREQCLNTHQCQQEQITKAIYQLCHGIQHINMPTSHKFGNELQQPISILGTKTLGRTRSTTNLSQYAAAELSFSSVVLLAIQKQKVLSVSCTPASDLKV